MAASGVLDIGPIVVPTGWEEKIGAIVAFATKPPPRQAMHNQ
jgi:hypothetical protein